MSQQNVTEYYMIKSIVRVSDRSFTTVFLPCEVETPVIKQSSVY